MKNKRMMSRALAAVLACCLVAPAIPETKDEAQVYAAEQVVQAQNEQEPDDQNPDTENENDNGDERGKGAVSLGDQPSIPFAETKSGKLPQASAGIDQAYYLSAARTSVKNQGSSNFCWAYSAAAAMEAELIQNNGFSVADAAISPIQTAYYVYNPAKDPFGTSMEATEYVANRRLVNEGGNQPQVISAFASGMAGTGEARVPIENYSEKLKLEASKAYTGEIWLKKAVMINSRDKKAMRDAIIKYGAVVIAFDCDSNYMDDTNGAIYKPANAENIDSGHAVCVVGWNDHYSRNNFMGQKPKKDGAWIIKNSWGVNYGNKGYYYMSYEDAFIWDQAYAYDVEPGKPSDYTYQHDYDFSNYGPGIGEKKMANVFHAHAGGDEELTKVGFGLYGVNQRYKIQIYTGLTDENNPESGTLADTITGKMVLPGYYNISTNQAIPISEGEAFSVVVELLDKDTFDGNIMVEALPESYMNSEAYALRAHGTIHEGETFYYGYDYAEPVGARGPRAFADQPVGNPEWRDYSTLSDYTGYGNAMIKAFTDSAETPSSVTINKRNVVIDSRKTQSVQLTASCGTYPIRWSSRNPEVATVDSNGKVTVVGNGIATIVARATTAGGTVMTNDCVIRVNRSPASFKLNKTELTLNLEKTYYLKGKYNLQDSSYYEDEIQWTSSNRRVCDVTEEGELMPVKAGTATITATLGSCTATCKVTVVNHYLTHAQQTAATANSITLKWDRVKTINYSGYAIYRSTSKNGKYKKIADVKKLSTVTFTDKNLKAGTTYYYKVTPAYYEAGIYQYAYSGQPKTCAVTKTKAVTVKAKATAKDKIKISWTKAAGASGYYVYAATSKKGKFTRIATIKDPKTLAYAYKGLKAGKTYYIKVVAYKSNGTKNFAGKASKAVSVTTRKK